MYYYNVFDSLNVIFIILFNKSITFCTPKLLEYCNYNMNILMIIKKNTFFFHCKFLHILLFLHS